MLFYCKYDILSERHDICKITADRILTCCDLRSQEDTNKNKSTEVLMLLKHIHGQVGGYRQPQTGPLCRMKILLPAVRNNNGGSQYRSPLYISM